MTRFANVLLVLAGLAVPTVAVAASGDTAPFYSGLLVNGDFFNNTSPWIHSNPTTGEMQYSDVDFTGEVGSGSALIFNLSPNDSGGDDSFQCVTGILPGETYSFGGNILLESNPTHTGYASLVISFFGTSNCQSSPLAGGGATNIVSSARAGHFVSVHGPALTAPAGAVAARVSLHTVKNQASFFLKFYFDDIYICGSEAACPIFADDFETGWINAWSAAQTQ
ncbi:MAG: hypothetical protein AB7G12_00995 [Thermoanaerobaculia bacterium]